MEAPETYSQKTDISSRNSFKFEEIWQYGEKQKQP